MPTMKQLRIGSVNYDTVGEASVTQTLTSGTEIATVTIDGTATKLYAPTYTLPMASTSTLGGVKVDGSTITADANGVISATSSGGGSEVSVTQTLTSGTEIGSVTIDGTSTTLYAPTPTTYTLPAATTSTLGGVIVGSGLAITNGVLSLDVASASGVSF